MKPFRVLWRLALLAGLPSVYAQTQIDLRTQSKSIDFSAAASTKPSQTGTVLPSTCSVGATFFNTAAAAGQNLFGCTAANTWTLLGSNLWFGGGTVNPGDCAAFSSSGNIVSAGGACLGATAITMATPFAAAGSLFVSAGPGRQGVPSLCTNSGGSLTCPTGFTGNHIWQAGSGTNTRQIVAPTGPFTNSFSYVWADAIPSSATLMKIGTPASGQSSLGPAIPDTDYVTPSGSGTLQNKTFDGTSAFSSYLPWAQISTPSAPAVGYLRVYAKTGVGVCWMNAAGAETCLGAGLGDPGGSGMLVETSPGVTANRTLAAGSSNISITNGSGSGGNPTVDIGATVNFSAKTTTPVQVGATAALPGTCSAGQLYFESDGAPGRQLQTCSAANTWSPLAYGQGSVNPTTCSIGQTFFNTSAPAGQNLYFCTAANTWNPVTGTISSIFERTGAITAQTGDYTYSQIADTPSALPPNGAASGDLSGSYPNPVVAQINGSAIPTTGMLKANSNHQVIAAISGTDYAPATSGASILKGNEAGGFGAAVAGADYMAPTTAVEASQMPALTGDCTTLAGTLATTCAKTNGVAFAPSATTDTTNAANISSGTLSANRLPSSTMLTNQSNTISGGTQDFHAAAHTLPAVTGTVAGMPGTCTAGEIYFATNATAGMNQYYCTATNVWTQQTGGGAIQSVFGRTGTITAQSDDYNYSQIANAPTSLPPNGAASGDLSGSYPSPAVKQVNGAAIPTSGVLKANSSGQIVAAVAETDYEVPLTFSGSLSRSSNTITCSTATASASGCLGSSDWNTFNNKQSALTNPITGTGSAGALAKFTATTALASAAASDIVNLFSGCSGTQYLGADGACHTPSGGSGGGGSVTMGTGSGAPSMNCAAPSSSSLTLYGDTSSNNDIWWCYATNSWKKVLSVTGSGPYQVVGATGSQLSAPASGTVECWFSGGPPGTQYCQDSNGNLTQMVQGIAAPSDLNAVTYVDQTGVQHRGNPWAIGSGQTAMPVTSLAGNSCSAAATTVTATGALPTDGAELTYATDPTGLAGYGGGTNGGVTIRAWITSNQINFKLCNETGSGITPGNLSVNWRIVR